MPWTTDKIDRNRTLSSSYTSFSRLKVPRFSLTSLWSSDSRSSTSSSDLPDPTTPTTPIRRADAKLDTTPRPPTTDTGSTSWSGENASESYVSRHATSTSGDSHSMIEEPFDSPETMETAESWNVETPKGDRNSRSGGGFDAAPSRKMTTRTALFQPGEEYARKMDSHSAFQASHAPESDLQVVLDDSPTVPGSTRPFAPTHSASSSADWRTAHQASALLHSVMLNGPVHLSEKQRGKLPMCETMSDTSHGMTNEEMHAELVDGITIANAYSSPSFLRRTSSLLTSSSSSSENYSGVPPSIRSRKSSKPAWTIPPPRTSSRPFVPRPPGLPSRGSSLAVDRVQPIPSLTSTISSRRTSISTTSSAGVVQLATKVQRPYLDVQKPLPVPSYRHVPPAKAPPVGQPPPPPSTLPPHRIVEPQGTVHSVLSLLDTLQEQAARPKQICASTLTPSVPSSHRTLRRVHSQPEFVRQYDQDDSMQIPFKFRIKRSGSARLAADKNQSVHPMEGMSTSQSQRFETAPLSQSQSFSQKLSARWGGSKRLKSGRAKPIVRPGLSALPEGWLNQDQPRPHNPDGSFYVDQLESPEAHEPSFNHQSIRQSLGPAIPDSPTMVLSPLPLPRDSLSSHLKGDTLSPLPPPSFAPRHSTRPMSIMSNDSLEARASEWASDVLDHLEEARSALREAETWLWPSPPPRTAAVPSLESGMSTSISASTLGAPITPPVSRDPSLDPTSASGSGSSGSERDTATWSRSRRTSKLVFEGLAPSAMRREQGFGIVEKYQYVQNNMDGTTGVVVEGTRRVTDGLEVIDSRFWEAVDRPAAPV